MNPIRQSSPTASEDANAESQKAFRERIEAQAKKEGVKPSTVWNRVRRRAGINPQAVVPVVRFRPKIAAGEIVEVDPPAPGEEITMRRVQKVRPDGRITLWRGDVDAYAPGSLVHVKKGAFAVVSVGRRETRLRPATAGEIVLARSAVFPSEANTTSEGGSVMPSLSTAELMQADAARQPKPGELSKSQLARRQRKANRAKGWPEKEGEAKP